MNCANRHHTALATLGGLVAAALTTLVVFASITALFASSGRTPWVPADRAQAVAHCADRRDAGSRHACLRATPGRQAAAAVGGRDDSAGAVQAIAAR